MDIQIDQTPIIARPDVFTYEIKDDLDFIILACDGIWERMSNQETIDFIRGEQVNPTESEDESQQQPGQADSGILLPPDENEVAAQNKKKRERIKFTGLARVIE